MNNLITTNELTMSSEQLSDLLQIRHDNLRAKAIKMKEAGNLAFTENLVKGAGRSKSVMSFDKRNSMIIAAKLNDKLLAAVVDRWMELENKNSQQPAWMQSISPQAMVLLDDMQNTIEQQNRLIETQKPAVEFVDNYTKAETGSKGFREVCKLLNVNERVFRNFLVDQKIMYTLGGSWTAHANHIKAGRFEVKTGETNGHVHNTTKFTGKGINWIVGLYAQHQISEK